MNLYYLVATERSKGRKPECTDTHAILARDLEHLKERCKELFIAFEAPHANFKLSKDWDD